MTIKHKFWQFIHDKLEQAWHWVYYHKLYEHYANDELEGFQYSVKYVRKDGSSF